MAAAFVTATVPGLRFFHDGQLEGRSVRLPIQLIREPQEALDPEVASFYERLLALIRRPLFHDGAWTFLKVREASGSDKDSPQLLAWSWQHSKKSVLVAVNYSPDPAQGWVDLNQNSLFVDLKPWQTHIGQPWGNE